MSVYFRVPKVKTQFFSARRLAPSFGRVTVHRT